MYNDKEEDCFDVCTSERSWEVPDSLHEPKCIRTVESFYSGMENWFQCLNGSCITGRGLGSMSEFFVLDTEIP